MIDPQSSARSEAAIREPVRLWSENQPTYRDLLELPTTIDVATAAAIVGVGRSTVYEMVRAGDWPTPVLRFRGAIRLPTAQVCALVTGPPRPERNPGS